MNYSILFEPVRIGPVVTKNRFYQVPHCSGLGYRDPSASAALRGMKAEGGWGVVCTEQTEIHHSSDITPFIELRIWNDQDMPMLARIADSIHEHDALAGIELAYNGLNGPNLYGREVPMAPTAMPVDSFTFDPVSARSMDREDIRNLRRWHREAALRSRSAGYDIVYVYAGHALGFFHHFMSRRYNHRTDEYGGSLTNRVRLLREILTDTREAIGDTCAIPCRISVSGTGASDDLEPAEVHDMIGMLAEIPDLWDFCVSGWENDSKTSRFSPEGFQEQHWGDLRSLTTKPVVGVGRYTSPDRMVSLVRTGKLDLIGAARPSIADPFLPNKIRDGRLEDIRECIGCNICVTGDFTMSPIRCTQNPSMGEEWRKGWHPEFIRKRESEKPVLVVGAGPAGLEAAQALGKRGYDVTLAEATRELGGRVARESGLPGLSAWIRVRDYRKQQLDQLPNVETYLESRLTAGDILELGIPRVVIATGSTWNSDGTGHHWTRPISIDGEMPVYTPDHVMSGQEFTGKQVLIWDDDHFYMGSVVAEQVIREAESVAFLTPAPEIASWTRNTMEQFVIQQQVMNAGVNIHTNRVIERIDASRVVASCYYTGKTSVLDVDAVLLVTGRRGNDIVYRELLDRRSEWDDAGLETVKIIGDAQAPATIAHAVYDGRRYAEEHDMKPDPNASLKRELAQLAPL